MEKRNDTKKWVYNISNSLWYKLSNLFFCLRYRLARNVSMTRSRRRIVTKSGQCNIGTRTMEQGRLKYFQDIFTTLLDMQWRLVLLIFSVSFFASWLFFAFLFWLIAKVHGDLEPMHLPPMQGNYRINKTICFRAHKGK